MARPKRVNKRDQAYNRRKAKRNERRASGKGFAEIKRKEREVKVSKMEEIRAGTLPTTKVTGSTVRKRKTVSQLKRLKREEVRRAKPREKALIMAQPLSARGEFAKRTEMKVPSTVIFWVEYYPDKKIMIIAFRVSGKYYTYFKVPLSIFQAFKLAPSKGRYFNKYIKGKYSFEPGAKRP